MPTSPPTATADLEARILDAALVAVARWGVTKTTVADVAKLARCSRASVYRAFPGGKDHLFAALGSRELTAFFARTGALVDATDSLADALVVGVVEAARFVAGHDALQYLLEHEPGVVLPVLGFKQVDRLYRAAGIFARPHLARFVGPDEAAWAAEWIGRLVLSFLFTPSPDLDLTDAADASHLVEQFLLPALAGPAGSPIASPEPAVPALQGS